MSSDLAANHVPPEFQISVNDSRTFFDDRLTIGGTVTRVGPRAADAEPAQVGYQTISAPSCGIPTPRSI